MVNTWNIEICLNVLSKWRSTQTLFLENDLRFWDVKNVCSFLFNWTKSNYLKNSIKLFCFIFRLWFKIFNFIVYFCFEKIMHLILPSSIRKYNILSLKESRMLEKPLFEESSVCTYSWWELENSSIILVKPYLTFV